MRLNYFTYLQKMLNIYSVKSKLNMLYCGCMRVYISLIKRWLVMLGSGMRILYLKC